MHKGGILLVTVATLACTACLGEGGKLEIRSVESGLKAGPEPVPFRIAEARSHLALGNVALALEGFRKAVRDDPASIEGYAGMADCYDRMGRFDLSRRYYEQALAVAPRNPGLLAAFAASLDRQGKRQEAMAVRQEMAALPQPQADVVVAETEAAPPAPAPVAEPVATTIAQAAPPLVAPAPVGQSVTIALPPPRPVDTPVAETSAPQAMAVAPVGPSVTIALPPPRPAPTAKPETHVTARKASPPQPRLVRLSLTEVALFTTDGPRWKKPTPQAQRLATVKPVELRILNAARVDRLAARTRAYLGDFGWRRVEIGDAAKVRSRSLIIYPTGSRAAASKLSSRFGFAMAPRNDVRQLTILLGRDAANLPALQRKS
jgi:tetratricopeptide (TPR) repeat protein